MKKILALLLSALMLLGLLAACGTPAAEESAPPSGEESAAPASEAPVPAEPVELKVWHDGDEAIMQTIADTVNPMLADSGVSLVFEKRTGLSDQLKLYGGDAANGPDMYFYAHDSLGTFAAMDILAPLTDLVDESTWAGDLEMTVEAGQIGGVQYLLPVYFETLLFIYNKALWQGDIPATTEELYEYMAANTDTAAGTYAVVNQHSTAYNVSPFINGFGGYIIDENANPGLNDAKTIEAVNKPTLIMEPNKTLAAQVASEMREMFPNNAVVYFVSYYDYYQPEAYVPQSDTYIEKDSSINDEIERLRHSATSSLSERRDVIVVSSVSCIYGLGDPIDYASMVISLRPGQQKDRDELLKKLIEIRYERNDIAFDRNMFRVRGDTVEVFPVYSYDKAIRIEFFGDEIDRISEINPVTGTPTRILNHVAIYPASH